MAPAPDVPKPPREILAPEIAALGGGMHHHAGPHACRHPSVGTCPYWDAVEAWVAGRTAREFVDDHPELLSVLGLVELVDADEAPDRGLNFVDREGRTTRELSEVTYPAAGLAGIPVHVSPI